MTQISSTPENDVASEYMVPRQFRRNIGWISPDEQEALANSVVSIAGAGGDGGELAVQLARLGVGEIRLADPDDFEEENLNRQACCTVDTVGRNKALAVGEHIERINPNLRIFAYTEGVTERNVEKFMSGADLVIDETEFTMHALGVMIARQARKQGIPDLMTLNIGFGSLTTTYHPKGRTLEAVLGLPKDASLAEIADMPVPLTKWLATLPNYADLEAFRRVAGESTSGEQLDVPSVAPGVASAAGTAAVQAMLSLLNGRNHRPMPVYAPRVISNDLMALETKIIRYPQLAIKYAMARMAFRSLLNLNPKTI